MQIGILAIPPKIVNTLLRISEINLSGSEIQRE